MSDHKLRDRFAELREEDRHALPDFARVASPRRTPVRSRVLIAAAAVGVASVAILVYTQRAERKGEVPAMSISEWRAPTDALLELGRPTVFKDLRSLGTSSLDAMVPPHNRPGVRR